MTYQQIYVLGEDGNYGKLDVEEISISETDFSIADINDISKRSDNLTKNIVLKGTKNNNRILGNLFNLNRVNDSALNEQLFFNFNINKDVDCLLYENDTLLLKGLFRVVSVNVKGGDKTFDCVITGHRVNFFAKLKDKLLSDLDFSEHNHQYTLPNITASWTGDKAYVYPFIDYGSSTVVAPSTIDKIDYSDFRPSFFVKEYVRQIFKQPALSGYTFAVTGSTDFIDRFNKLIVPNNTDVLANNIKGVILSGTKSSSQTFGGETDQNITDPFNGKPAFQSMCNFQTYTNGVMSAFSISNYLGVSNAIYTATKEVTTTVSSTINCHWDMQGFNSGSVSNTIAFDAEICVIGRASIHDEWGVLGRDGLERITLVEASPITPTKQFKIKTNLNLPVGGQVAVMIYCTNYVQTGFPFIPDNEECKIIYEASGTVIKFGEGGETNIAKIEINQNLEFGTNDSLIPFKQSDFLKSLISMFNLYVYSSIEEPKKIIFEPYNDFYSRFLPQSLPSNALDWSKKIDYSELKIDSFQQIFKNYKFIFKEDTDYLNAEYKKKWNETYGNYIYNNNTSVTTDSTVEVIFASTPITTIGGRNFPMFFNYASNNNKVPKQTILRLLSYNGLKPCNTFQIGDWAYSSGAGGYVFNAFGGASYSSYPEVHTLNGDYDLNFGMPNEVYYGAIPDFKTLYDVYYSNQIKEFNDSNTYTVDAKVHLNEIDIAHLDFRSPIYFDSPSGDGYFKLLKVNYSNNQELSDIELQKVI